MFEMQNNLPQSLPDLYSENLLMTTIFGSQEQSANRRSSNTESSNYSGPERRQFRDSHSESNPEVGELAQAVDQYKMNHRRRFITYEELHSVITELGYKKETEVATADCV